MTTPDVTDIRARLRRWEMISRLLGLLAASAFRAYGAAAALSVALSPSETFLGKLGDAFKAVPNLMDRYRAGAYVVEHREEIQTAVDYLHTHTPPQAELEATVAQSTQTLDDLATMIDGVNGAKDSLLQFPPAPLQAKDHVMSAWNAIPDQDSLRQLGDTGEFLAPYVGHARTLIPAYHDSLFTAVDNFASDEITSTVLVMVLALITGAFFAQVAGFVVRRGKPGFVVGGLQRLGIRVFPQWYDDDPRVSLGDSVYGVAHRHLQAEIIRDPEAALDPDTLRALQRHFAAQSSP